VAVSSDPGHVVWASRARVAPPIFTNHPGIDRDMVASTLWQQLTPYSSFSPGSLFALHYSIYVCRCILLVSINPSATRLPYSKLLIPRTQPHRTPLELVRPADRLKHVVEATAAAGCRGFGIREPPSRGHGVAECVGATDGSKQWTPSARAVSRRVGAGRHEMGDRGGQARFS
jgi:hypothetical protein